MKNLYHLLFISVTCTFINCKTEIKTKNTTTVLIGEVIDRPYSNKLLLTSKNGDTRVNNIEIPIKEGRFKYILESDFIQEFSLAFNDEILQGSWRPIHFFNDKDTIKMTLFEQDKADLNVVFVVN